LSAIALTILFTLSNVALAQVATQSTPQFGPVTCAYDHTIGSVAPIDPDTVFPAGIQNLSATVVAENLELETEVSAIWFKDGQIAGESVSFIDENSIDENVTSPLAFFLSNTNGLAAGSYEIRVYYRDEVVARTTCLLATSPTISSLRLGTDLTQATREVIDESDDFATGTKLIFAAFKLHHFPAGAVIETEWLHNGIVAYTSSMTVPVAINSISRNAWVRIRDNNSLTAGNWELRLLVNGVVLRSATFTIE
jgi:hypothetical protein